MATFYPLDGGRCTSEGPAVTGVVLVAVAAVRTNVVLVDLVEVD